MEDTTASSQAEMMYKIRQKVMAKSHSIKKAAGIKIKRGRMKMPKYQELKTLDSFHSVIPAVKPKEKKTPPKRQIIKRDPRPSRQASTVASEKLSALDAEVFSDDDTEENFHPRCPKPVRLKKRVFRETQDDWSSEDDDWNLGNTDTKSKKRALLPPPPPVLSEYEKSIQQKVAERQKFLEELGISQAKKELEDLHKSTSAKPRKQNGRMPISQTQRLCKKRNLVPSNSEIQEEYPMEDTGLPHSNEVDSLKNSPSNVTNTENSTYSRPHNSVLSNSEVITSPVDVGPGKTTEVLTEPVVTDKKIPQMMRRLRSSAVKAGKHAKSAKMVSKSLKKNINKLTNADSHSKHVLNTLGDAKRKFQRIIT